MLDAVACSDTVASGDDAGEAVDRGGDVLTAAMGGGRGQGGRKRTTGGRLSEIDNRVRRLGDGRL